MAHLVGDIRPLHRVEVQHVAVIQVVEPVAATEDIETAIPEARAVPVPPSWGLALDFALLPHRGLEVEAPDVVVLSALGARAPKDVKLRRAERTV